MTQDTQKINIKKEILKLFKELPSEEIPSLLQEIGMYTREQLRIKLDQQEIIQAQYRIKQMETAIEKDKHTIENNKNRDNREGLTTRIEQARRNLEALTRLYSTNKDDNIKKAINQSITIMSEVDNIK